MTWQTYAFGSAFFAALTTILAKVGVSGLNSNFATLVRTAVVVIFSACLVSLRHEWVSPSQVAARNFLFLILSGLATGLSWLCYYRALQMTDATRVATVDKLSLVFVLVLSLLFLNEPFSWRVFAGAILVVLGIIIIIQ